MRRLVPLASAAAIAAAIWLAFRHGFANYDTLYALVWGSDVAHGRTPDYDVTLAPTPHPLATFAGLLLSPLGTGAEAAVVLAAFATLGAIGWLLIRIGQEAFGLAAGIAAAVLFLTREPVLSFGVRAYVDLPYVALLLGALLVELRRPRAGAPVLALLTAAGLLRPEAWLFAAAYWAWLWHGGLRGRPLIALGALAAAAPLIWALCDLLVTGNPLHSLTDTRETADQLGRVTGLDDVPVTVPRRLGEVLREPGLLAAAAGAGFALMLLRRRAIVLAAAGAVAIAAFVVLAGAGLPILARYLLGPAAILSLFAGAGLAGWARLPAESPWRRRWQVAAVVLLAAFVAFAPAQARRLDRLQAAIAAQDEVQEDLAALIDGGAVACTPVAVPNHRPVPLVALWGDVRPAEVVSAQLERPASGIYFDPSRFAERVYTLDPRDARRLDAAPPPGFTAVARGRFWTALQRCE